MCEKPVTRLRVCPFRATFDVGPNLKPREAALDIKAPIHEFISANDHVLDLLRNNEPVTPYELLLLESYHARLHSALLARSRQSMTS
jgi:hypothetical protein